jgi:hypothetical protein
MGHCAGATINMEAIYLKNPEMWAAKDGVLLLIQQKLTKHDTVVLPQPMYSPDLAPFKY